MKMAEFAKLPSGHMTLNDVASASIQHYFGTKYPLGREDPDEAAQHELPHLDLHFLHSYRL